VLTCLRRHTSSILVAGLLVVAVATPQKSAASSSSSTAAGAESCNTAAEEAAEKGNEASNKAADLAAVGYVLMGVMTAAIANALLVCADVYTIMGCPAAEAAAVAATAAYMAFSAANGDPATNTANAAGLAENAAKNAEAGKACEGNENEVPDPSSGGGLTPGTGGGNITTPGGTTPPCSALASAGLSNALCGDTGTAIRDSLNTIRTDLSTPNLKFPDGVSSDSLNSQVSGGEDALSGLDSGSMTAGKGGDSGGGGRGAGAGKDTSKGGAKGVASGGAGLGDDDFFGGKTGKAGPVDRKGLGKVTIKNGLTMIDDETGQELTIWQRTTRRYQGGPEGTRAFALARMEWVRQEAAKKGMKAVLPALASAKAPATVTYGEVGTLGNLTQAPLKPASTSVPAPKDVRPASVPDSNTKKHSRTAPPN